MGNNDREEKQGGTRMGNQRKLRGFEVLAKGSVTVSSRNCMPVLLLT